MAQAPNQSQNFLQRAQEYIRGNTQQQPQRGDRQNNNQSNQNRNTQQNDNTQQNNQQPANRQTQQNQNNNNQDGLNDPENRQTPFDAYKGLWDNVDNSAEQAPDFKLDDKLINGTADTLDFLRDLPEDLQQELSEHFGERMPAISKLMNHIGRRAYATALTHNTALTDKYMKVKDGFSQKGLGRSIKEHMALTGIASHEAAQKNPIIRETLQMIGSKLAKLHPDASPDWIRDKSFEFFKEVNNAMNPTPETTQKQEAVKPGGSDFDWETWGKSDIKRDL